MTVDGTAVVQVKVKLPFRIPQVPKVSDKGKEQMLRLGLRVVCGSYVGVDPRPMEIKYARDMAAASTR